MRADLFVCLFVCSHQISSHWLREAVSNIDLAKRVTRRELSKICFLLHLFYIENR